MADQPSPQDLARMGKDLILEQALVDGRWVPTFPNARYLIGRAEFDHWQARDR